MDLYRYFGVYEKQGHSALLQLLIEEQYKLYDEAALKYVIEAVEKELCWRVGPKADYLREVLLVTLQFMWQKRRTRG